ncbi:MAG: porin family protein [Mediterranea sp.]|jgi:hypothetical protein|nr:porin family protein [Mediterranea sp.]
MKKSNDDITRLFRERLENSEMEVRDNFWEELQKELPAVTPNPHTPILLRFHRIAVAASVAFVLVGAASAVYWYTSRKAVHDTASLPVATVPAGIELNGDKAPDTFAQEIPAEQTTPQPSAPTVSGKNLLAANSRNHTSQALHQASQGVNDTDDEQVQVTVSVTITQRVYPNNNRMPAQDASDVTTAAGTEAQSVTQTSYTAAKPRNWAVKAGIGTSLPKGEYRMPIGINASVERRLSEVLALEAGLQYNYFPQKGDEGRHSVALPVHLNALLLQTEKVALYALAGGKAELQDGGGSTEGSNHTNHSLLWSVRAGAGMRYHLNDRFALFAEATVSHHFERQNVVTSLHTERPTNFNLLCGIRMTY